MLDLTITSGTGGEPPLSVHRGIMADLLQRIAERADPAAFRELYEAYGPRVKAYMMRQGADAGTAEDLAQETLLTVGRKAALYAGGGGRAPRRAAGPRPPRSGCPTRRWPRRSGRSGCRRPWPSCPRSRRTW